LNNVMPDLNPDYTYRCRDCGHLFKSKIMYGVPMSPDISLEEAALKHGIVDNPVQEALLKVGVKLRKGMEKAAQSVCRCPGCGGHNVVRQMDFMKY